MKQRKLTPEEQSLVAENVALAQYLFHQYSRRFQRNIDFTLDYDELLSQAYLGLIRAAMRYRAYGEERGYTKESLDRKEGFSYFARKSIIGQMLDHLRKLDHVHTLVRKDYKLLVQHGFGSDQVSEEELSEATGLSVERIQKVIRAIQSRPVSMNDTHGESDLSLGDGISSSHDVESSALVAAVRDTFVKTLQELPELERLVVVLKYYEGSELPVISEELGVRLPIIRKAHTQALVTIHEAMHKVVKEIS